MPRNRYHSGPASDHFDGRFFNLSPTTRDKGLADIRRWRRTSTPTPWPEKIDAPRVAPPEKSEALRITVVGHATVLMQTRGLNLLTDPFWSERASPLPFAGPKRACPPAVEFDALPRINAVLLSHNHYDHMDMATLRRLVKRDAPLIVTPLGNDAIVRKAIPSARLHAFDWWDDFRLSDSVAVTLTPAQHWSSRFFSDRRMALWGGFFVRSGAENIYFAGDTGFGDGSLFKNIRQKLGAPDVALLPIGAYEPRWFMADQHTNPEDAVAIFEHLETKQAIGIHWGVIRLTDEGREAPKAALAEVLRARGIAEERFVAAEPGFEWLADGGDHGCDG